MYIFKEILHITAASCLFTFTHIYHKSTCAFVYTLTVTLNNVNAITDEDFEIDAIKQFHRNMFKGLICIHKVNIILICCYTIRNLLTPFSVVL